MLDIENPMVEGTLDCISKRPLCISRGRLVDNIATIFRSNMGRYMIIKQIFPLFGTEKRPSYAPTKAYDEQQKR
jgi:hypothetical protein